MRPLLWLAFLAILASYGWAQAEPAVDNNVVLQVSFAAPQRQFHIGEIIPLQLSFSAGVKDEYQVNMAQYDRSGRMEYERFSISPADGAVDPFGLGRSSVGGGLTGFSFLGVKPWTIQLNLNEWLRFTRPGEYRLSVISHRVSVKDPSSPVGATPVSVRSNELRLTIVPAPLAWQKAVLEQAVSVLDQGPPAKPADLEAYVQQRRSALEKLRFLGTPEAIRELANRMPGEQLGNLSSICMLGLITAPDREIARRALEDSLADPDHAIDQSYLYALRAVSSTDEGGNAHGREDQTKAAEELINVLPDKRGKALTTSLMTAVNEAWNGAALPQQTTEKLVQQLISRFDELTPQQQNLLLTYRWDKIAGPGMLPILRRYAQAYRNVNPSDSKTYDSFQLGGSALQHWYELDPAGARPAIIAEIVRPRPRYDARVLGILPDKTLPEVDFPLAQHFLARDDFDGLSNVASLIGRYATGAILPPVLGKLDPAIGKWACAIQSPILAYVLRVAPGQARPRIEQALAARGNEYSGCYRELLQDIAGIYFSPVLQEIALRSLDDPDPQVGTTAATVLGKFGTADVEPILWQHFKDWNAKWAGSESEFDLTFAEMGGERMYDRNLGENLLQALVAGNSWLTDADKLQRLTQITRVRRFRQILDGDLKVWSNPPLTIFFNHNPEPAGLDARIAQYEFHSISGLENKLEQFAPGTKFFISTPPRPSPGNAKSLAELRSFLQAHRMVLAGEKHSY